MCKKKKLIGGVYKHLGRAFNFSFQSWLHVEKKNFYPPQILKKGKKRGRFFSKGFTVVF